MSISFDLSARSQALELLAASTSLLISDLFGSSRASSSSAESAVAGGRESSSITGEKKSKEFVSSQFCKELDELMIKVSKTRPHYVRCLKPNNNNIPDELDRCRIVEQLRYGGVLEAVRVARAGFPVRYPHSEFVTRYALAPAPAAVQKAAAEKLVANLSSLSSAPHGLYVGKTKVFLKQGMFEALEARRARVLHALVVLQAAVRRRAAARDYTTQRHGVIRFQRWYRQRRPRQVDKAPLEELIATARNLKGLLADDARIWKQVIEDDSRGTGTILFRELGKAPDALGPPALVTTIALAERDESRKQYMTTIQKLLQNPKVPVTPEVRKALHQNDFWHRRLILQPSSADAVAALGLRAPDLMDQKDKAGRKAIAFAVPSVKKVKEYAEPNPNQSLT